MGPQLAEIANFYKWALKNMDQYQHENNNGGRLGWVRWKQKDMPSAGCINKFLWMGFKKDGTIPTWE